LLFAFYFMISFAHHFNGGNLGEETNRSSIAMVNWRCAAICLPPTLLFMGFVGRFEQSD